MLEKIKKQFQAFHLRMVILSVAFIFTLYGLALGVGKLLMPEPWLGFIIIGVCFIVGIFIINEVTERIRKKIIERRMKKYVANISDFVSTHPWESAAFALCVGYGASQSVQKTGEGEEGDDNKTHFVKRFLYPYLISGLKKKMSGILNQ